MTNPFRRSSLDARTPGVALGLALIFACHAPEHQGPSPDASPVASPAYAPALLEATLTRQKLSNVVAYIPPQCFTKTRASDAAPAKNPCYVCHTDAPPPSFAADASFQLLYALPEAATQNPWTNLFDPPVTRAARASDADTLAYVRHGNYVGADGAITLARTLDAPPPEWDIDGNGAWDGYRPDVGFHFDDRGFDHVGPGGEATGWRAFGYYPFPGTFFPTNGSADDALIRLDPRLRQDENGRADRRIEELNFAIVEALITRSDVPIDPIDEAAVDLDVDLDGRLARADHVAFDQGSKGGGETRMHYAGRAGLDQRAGQFPIAVGLFPLGTEFFHTVRYLDVDATGAVTMAPRMKEVRYAKKTAFLDYETLRGRAAADAREQLKSRDGSRRVNWQGERGVDNGQGWVFQGFIEDARGELRPQTREETTYCVGCHGGIGVTTDSIFSFPRKLGANEVARGWFHWSQRGLVGIAEPKRTDGRYEYATYLEEAGAGDELRENTEILGRFFDDRGRLRKDELRALHGDVARLLVPTPARALDLDRAAWAIVREQSFTRGREAVLGSSRNVHATAPIGQPTGVRTAVAFAGVSRGTR